MYILSVIPFTKIPRPAPQTLDYFSTKKAAIGGIVEVSLGKRKILAVAVSCSSVLSQKQQIKKSSFSLKPIERIINDKSIIPKHHLALILWTSNYFYSPVGLVAKSMLPQLFSRPTKKFIEDVAMLKSDFNRPVEIGFQQHRPVLYWNKHNEQKKISFYKKQIQETLKNRMSVLFLVPQLYKIEYFQKKIAALREATIVHSGHTPKIQHDIWEKATSGKIEIIIGTRSSLSMPLKKLGLIIIDEEGSQFYKSFDQQPYINARDVAIKLAELTGAKIILGANLPSIESFWKAKTRKYESRTPSVESQTPRWGSDSPNHKVKLVDMRKELKSGNFSIFSKELKTQLIDTIKNKKQAILFINRRGLSTGLLCRDCGHIIKCHDCDVPLVFHSLLKSDFNRPVEIRFQQTSTVLICHHCGKKQKPPTVCPKCESYKIKFIGAGTQRVEQELKKLFSENKTPTESYQIARLDSDITPNWEQQKEILQKFKEKKYNILIGTQTMLKEGLLPKVNLVSIITIDPLLSLPDFMVNEQIHKIIDRLKTLSLSTILLQTYIIDNDVVKNVCNDNACFFKNELKNRKELSLPPFSQIIKLSYRHSNIQKADQEAQIMKNKLLTQLDNCQLTIRSCQILGPAPAFIPRVKNSYIWQIMIKSKIRDVSLRNKLLRIVPSHWRIDVDPVDMV